MAKRKPQALISGTATHRRTEGDYMGALLDTVTLDDWRDVVAGALQAAKAGDAQARAWLAQYLVGKPAHKAPQPLAVVVQQWSGGDPLVDRLAKPAIDKVCYPSMHQNDEWEGSVKARVAAELAEKLAAVETSVMPDMAWVTGDLASGNVVQLPNDFGKSSGAVDGRIR